MSVPHSRLIIVDLEATCWLEDQQPPDQMREIIEIGLCVFDMATYEPRDKCSILVKPTVSTLSDYCTELTTLTQAQVDKGMSFVDACTLLEVIYDTPKYAWGSWGNFDFQMFHEQCKRMGVRYPFSKTHINIKKVFRKVYQVPGAFSMAMALELAELSAEGTPHRGDDDAWNIARLTGAMLRQHGEDTLRRYWK